ncbi:MAG: ABC transporter ATP-binding protein [Proteobacteria bacterium]|nr:ABC transporter ATP-binding protein [Pseudomonadota bacterium]
MGEPATVSAPVLVVEGVVKEFGDVAKTRALDGVDLTVGPGELTALIGPSGSGKSTLLNIIGLLERPTAGRVLLGGHDTSQLDEPGLTAMRARMLGFVFQFHHLLPARAAALLKRVGLGARQGHYPSQLSGGEQQRVAIARALASRPPLVLADEPTGNLDTASSKEVFALMRRFNRERGTTFIVVTHDPRIAEGCDRVVELVDGRIQSDRAVVHPPDVPDAPGA